MSHIEDLRIINSLIGSPCERSLAHSSLKIRFGCEADPKGKSYIWIDPPWEFQTADSLITESYDCPFPDEKGYSEDFEAWSTKFNPLNATKLLGAIFTEEKELELEFEGGFYIYVPYTQNDIADDDYEHWYAKSN
jgi:hypothetical protein